MSNEKDMQSVVHYDEFDEHVTVELNISTKFILTNEGLRDLHDLYFDTVRQVLEDIKDMQE